MKCTEMYAAKGSLYEVRRILVRGTVGVHLARTIMLNGWASVQGREYVQALRRPHICQTFTRFALLFH